MLYRLVESKVGFLNDGLISGLLRLGFVFIEAK